MAGLIQERLLTLSINTLRTENYLKFTTLPQGGSLIAVSDAGFAAVWNGAAPGAVKLPSPVPGRRIQWGKPPGGFPHWPGGGVPGNHSEGAPGDPLIPFPSWGKECLPGEGPRPQARKPRTVSFRSRKATSEEATYPKEAALTMELQGTALPQALRASSLGEGA